MRIHSITTLALPDLEPYRTLRDRTWHWQRGYFVAEGGNVVRRLFASNLDIVSLLLSNAWFERLRPSLEEERHDATDVYLAPDDLLETITGVSMHQRVMAIGRIPAGLPLDTRAGRLHVALEGIADAENMGMIIRTCAAMGAHSLIAGPDSCSPWLRRSVRVSVGAVFSLPVHIADDLTSALARARDRYGWLVVATTPEGGMPALRAVLERYGRDRTLCLLFGSEGHGLTAAAMDLCEARYTIPMQAGIDSLNVAHAVAVALFDARVARKETEA